MSTEPGSAARTVPESRFPALDGLRIVGAVAVVTTHVGFHSGAALVGPFAGVLARLDSGVALFFVISGFLLFGPQVRAHLAGIPRPATRPYLWHRALRILPPLWIAVLGTWAFVPLSSTLTPWTYLRHATLTQIYGTDGSTWGLTQMWSLATEAAFYLVLPLLAWVLTRRRPGRSWARRTIALLAAAELLALAWLALVHSTGFAQGALWLPGYLGWFGAGMALASWHWSRRAGVLPPGRLDEAAATPGALYALAAAGFVVLSTPVAGPYGLEPPTVGAALTKNLGYAVLATIIVLPAVAPVRSGSLVVRVLSSRPARWLGDISYGVFCYHLIVLELVERAIGYEPLHGQFALLEAATLGLTIPLAWLSYRFVERPIIRWGRLHGPDSPDSPGSPGSPQAADVTTTAAMASTPS